METLWIGRRRLLEERPFDVTQKSPRNSLQMNNPNLPPGYISQIDPSSGKVFYVETASGKAGWSYPTTPTPSPPQNAPPVPPPRKGGGGLLLPPNYIEQFDSQGRPFFVNLA